MTSTPRPRPPRAAPTVTAWIAVVACAALAAPARATAPRPPTPIPQSQATRAASIPLYPGTAAPGDPVWFAGPRAPRVERVWVGGVAVPARTDPTSGWLEFTVPRGVGGGPQTVSVSGPGGPGPTVTVLPDADGTVLYADPERLDAVRRELPARLDQLRRGCQQACPPAVTATLTRLARQERLLPAELAPLRAERATPTAPRDLRVTPRALPSLPPTAPTARMRPPLALPPLLRPARPTPPPTPFCGWVAGPLDPGPDVPAGQAITLLHALFGGSLGVDPSTFGHPIDGTVPYHAGETPPYHNESPRTILEAAFGAVPKGGRGVTIHVLDTAGPTGDPYVMPDAVTYYDTVIPDPPGGPHRPYHGAVVAGIAGAVAPGATVRPHPVCDKTGTCSTLDVVRALCAVEAAAARGGKHVVNLSAGGPYPALGVNLALRAVAARGVPTAAAYGNRDDCEALPAAGRCHHYPADWHATFATTPTPGSPTLLLSVAGWDIGTRQFATYNRGTRQPGPTAPPPSVQVPGEFWVGGLPYFGTSFAAPVVAGLLANHLACHSGVPALPLVTTPGQPPLPPAALAPCP